MLLPLAFLVASSACAPSPSSGDPVPTAAAVEDAAAIRDLRSVLQPIRERHDVPGLVACVVRGTDVVAHGADGVRKRGSPEPILVTDRMHLGSCTKAMTATLCARLVEEKKLAWDTRVGEVFPELADRMHPDWRGVRLDQLLTNHAGAPAELDAGGLWLRLCTHAGKPREQRLALVEGVVTRAPQVAPGTKFVYSNAGFSIAGAMAERVTDTPYEDLMRRRVFEPLGMKSTGFGAPGTMGILDQPRGHGADGKPIEVGPRADNPIAIAPAGRVHASIGDWARFVGAHLVGEKDADDGQAHLLSGTVFRKLHTPFAKDESKYAYGWIADERPWGGRVLTHAGSNTMWYCVAWLVPDRNVAVLVACNQGGDAAAKACDEAASALLKENVGADPKQNAGPGDSGGSKPAGTPPQR